MKKRLTHHFAVAENLHRAVKSVAAEDDTKINLIVESALLSNPDIKKAFERIESK